MQKCGVLILALTVVPLLAAPVRAHPADGRHIEATSTREGLELTVTADATRAALAAGVGAEIDEQELSARRDLLQAWLARGLDVRADGTSCNAEHGDVHMVEQTTGRAVAHTMRFVCPEQRTHIELWDHELEGANPAAQTIVSLDGTAHVLWPGAEHVRVERRSWSATAFSFATEGVVHLVTGYDHLLFVFTLLLAAGVRSRERGTRGALIDAARIVTAFTIGHSVTLALAALDVVVAPSALVESAIAASVAIAAVLNLWRPSAGAERPWLALGFGLVHGFGFSSVLAEVGLPKGERVLALFSFNVGIELAQLCFVALVLWPLALLAQRRFYERAVLVPGSLAIAAVAAFWFVERASGA